MKKLTNGICYDVCRLMVVFFSAFALVLFSPGSLSAQPDRIAGFIDSRNTVMLRGNLSPLARAANDQGPVASSLEIPGIVLTFKRTDAQEADLQELLLELQDPASANYHKWLNQGQYADRFGISVTDMAQLVSWLQSQGFTIKYATQSRTSVFFAGFAENVRNTFHTEIHYYKSGSETHYAASTEPEIPTALQSIVFGLRGTDDFYPRPSTYFPTLGIGGLLPVDLRTIYDIPSSITQPGQGGIGIGVGVIGQATLTAADVNGDIASYYHNYSQINPGSGLPLITLWPGPSPKAAPATDFEEAYLDIDLALAVAPDAVIQYYYSASAWDAAAYAIDQNASNVLSMSFAQCEPDMAVTSAESFRMLAQQANAFGMTWVAASGDQGAAGTSSSSSSAFCAFPGATAAPGTSGFPSVNMPASIPEVTGVGGTRVNNGAALSTCNNALNHSFSCYPGEAAWNNNPPFASFTGPIAGSGGGLSQLFPAPAWQTGLSPLGVGSGGMTQRGVPDVAFAASNAEFDYPYVILWNGQLTAIGGTSAATPVFAGIVALLNQHESAIGQPERLGDINPALYRLAQIAPALFHDVTAGSNLIPDPVCTARPDLCPLPGSWLGYYAGPGYDLVTGLGSVDTLQLITNWLTTVAKAPQTIDFGSPGSGPALGIVTANAEASTGLLITFTSNSPSVCTASGIASPWVNFNGQYYPGVWSLQVKLLAAGTCSITASQPGNSDYLAATPVTQTFTVTGATSQIITFGPLSGVSLGIAPFALTATASSGLPVVLTSGYLYVCTVSGSTVTIVAGGTCSITASQSGNASYAAAIPVTQTFTVIAPSALQFHPVAPCRIMDTTQATGPLGGPSMGAATSRTIPILSSNCGVPVGAMAYSLNFTVVPTGSLDSLTVWPAGITKPNVSTLTTPGGSAVASAAIVPAGTGGAISAYTTDATDLIVDINGYFVPPAVGTLQFYPLSPCRVLDTRTPAAGGTFPANSTFGSPSLATGVQRSYPIPSSSCGAPATAAAYSFNLTAVPQGTLGYVNSFPTGQALPFVSTLNSWNGTVLANAAIVPAGTNGAVSFFASNTTDLVVDINGYFALPGTGGLNFYTVNPCRLVDTRNANGDLGGPIIGNNASRNFPVLESNCGLPASAAVEAYSLSITAFPQSVLGYLATWPAGGAQPFVSTLNAWNAQNAANAALVPAGTGGAVSIFVTAPTNVTIDTAGYFGR